MNSKFNYLKFQVQLRLNIDRPTTSHIAIPNSDTKYFDYVFITRYQIIQERCLGNHSMF